MCVIKETDPISNKIEVRNSLGQIARYLISFDIKTKEAEFYAIITHDEDYRRPATIGKSFDEGLKLVTFKCILLGYNAYWKDTNTLITELDIEKSKQNV